MKTKLIFLVYLFLIGCSTEKEIISSDEIISSEVLLRDEFIKHNNSRQVVSNKIEMQCSVEANFNNNSASGKLEIFAKIPDSVLVRASGPFGISIGNLLITKNKFTVYDNINGTISEHSQFAKFPQVDSIYLNYIFSFLTATPKIEFTLESPIDSVFNDGNKSTVMFAKEEKFISYEFDNKTKNLITAFMQDTNYTNYMLLANFNYLTEKYSPRSFKIISKIYSETILDIFVDQYNTSPTFTSIAKELPSEEGYTRK